MQTQVQEKRSAERNETNRKAVVPKRSIVSYLKRRFRRRQNLIAIDANPERVGHELVGLYGAMADQTNAAFQAGQVVPVDLLNRFRIR
jgi:hypothetical protein